MSLFTIENSNLNNNSAQTLRINLAAGHNVTLAPAQVNPNVSLIIYSVEVGTRIFYPPDDMAGQPNTPTSFSTPPNGLQVIYTPTGAGAPQTVVW
jgi:hypothetical protein